MYIYDKPGMIYYVSCKCQNAVWLVNVVAGWMEINDAGILMNNNVMLMSSAFRQVMCIRAGCAWSILVNSVICHTYSNCPDASLTIQHNTSYYWSVCGEYYTVNTADMI